MFRQVLFEPSSVKVIHTIIAYQFVMEFCTNLYDNEVFFLNLK